LKAVAIAGRLVIGNGQWGWGNGVGKGAMGSDQAKYQDIDDLSQKKGLFSALNRCFWGRKEQFKESFDKRYEFENTDGG
jgi:hypothetical protein